MIIRSDQTHYDFIELTCFSFDPCSSYLNNSVFSGLFYTYKSHHQANYDSTMYVNENFFIIVPRKLKLVVIVTQLYFKIRQYLRTEE